MTLTDSLESERKRQSLSLNELARRSDQSPGRVHSILTGETANPSFDTVLALLRGLGKSLAWLEKSLK